MAERLGWGSRLLRQFRAIFVAFHIVAVCLSAAPAPGAGMNRAAWSDPTVQREFNAWADRLGQDPDSFQDRIWAAAVRFVELRRAVLKPFVPYLRTTGTEQSWQMFVAPHRWPTRLQIQVSRDPRPALSSEWETLFEERSDTATWKAEFFERERMRATVFRWGWPTYAEAYKRGCNALAQLIFEEMPEILTVRCRFSRVQSPGPAKLRAGDKPVVEWRYARVVKRP